MAIRLTIPFGVAWENLERDHVTTFLAGPVEESLTWEVKGGDIRPEHIRKAASSFGNSELGGVLILGATQDRHTRRWQLDHWTPPEPDVELWVNRCLNNHGVEPRPSTAVRPWDLDGGGKLACVAIWPVAVPPVITSSGQVWERTSSESVQVKDPTALRLLFDRGKAAEDRIQRLSNEQADGLFTNGPDGRPQVAVLAAGAASLPSDISAVLFRESFALSVREYAKNLMHFDVGGDLRRLVQAASTVNQGAVTAWSVDGTGGTASYSIRVGRHGSVAVGYSDTEVEWGAEWTRYAEAQLMRMWECANLILTDLDAKGRSHFAARFSGRDGALAASQPSDLASNGHDELDRIIRDIRRGTRYPMWEPEPPVEAVESAAVEAPQPVQSPDPGAIAGPP